MLKGDTAALGILSGLQTDPRGTLISLLYAIPAILISLTLHEMAHGYVALRCGDPTAQMLGRLSFNPLRHLDPVGTLCMVVFGFGWARPVPVNPRNFKNYRRDDFLVSIAGVVVNFCLFFLSMLVIVGVNEWMWDGRLWQMGEDRKYFVSVFEYVVTDLRSGEAVPLFTAYRQFLKTPWLEYVIRFFKGFARINLGLCLFNLLPIPPLDGYHVVNDIFLRGRLHIPANVTRIISLALMAVIFMPGWLGLPDVFGNFLGTAVDWVQSGVSRGLLTLFGLG